MPPKPQGDRVLTIAERQARHRERKAAKDQELIAALERIQSAHTIREARSIAGEALAYRAGRLQITG